MKIVALTLGSILLIASTACVTIIFNAILSPLMLGESFKIYPDLVTIIFLSFGCTLAASQLPQNSPPLNDDLILDKLTSKTAIIYQGFLLLIILVRLRHRVVLDRLLQEFRQQCVQSQRSKLRYFEKQRSLYSSGRIEEDNFSSH